jgi:hypothetical protein
MARGLPPGSLVQGHHPRPEATMPIFHAHRPDVLSSREARLARAAAEYLAVSCSTMRVSSPARHDLTEEKAWERVCRAAGIGPPPDRAPREEHRC